MIISNYFRNFAAEGSEYGLRLGRSTSRRVSLATEETQEFK